MGAEPVQDRLAEFPHRTMLFLSGASRERSVGNRLRGFPVETSGQAWVEAISAIPGHRHLIMEEGTRSSWLYETLERHVDEIVVANVRESRGQVCDQVDGKGLVRG